MLQRLLDDVRHGTRVLTKSPGLSLTAALLVALVVGGNTTIYSMINGMARRPAPGVTRPDLLSFSVVGRGDGIFFRPGEYAHYAAQARTLRSLAAYGFARSAVATPNGSHLLGTLSVTPNYFDTIGVQPARGRVFADSDDREGAPLVAVISDRLWTTHFQRDVNVVGRPLSINGGAATIVGVAPPRFLGLSSAEATDVWVPMRSAAHLTPTYDVAMIGRRADVASLGQIRSEFDVLHARLQAAVPAAERRPIRVSPYAAAAGTGLVDFQREIVAAVSVLTLLTLLVVCANVANLMLARAVAQQRDTAVRQSLGASRVRIARLVFFEGLSIAAVACAAAFALAWWTARLIPRVLPQGTGLEVGPTDFTPDWRVVLYAMVVTLLGAVFFTIVPALRTWRQDPLPALKDGASTTVPGGSRASNALVMLQLAFSVLLLTIGGLAYRASSLIDADAGFDTQRLLLVGVSTVAAATPAAHSVVVDRIHQRLRAIPGVAAASYAERTAPFSWQRQPVAAPDRAPGPPVVVRLNAVAPDYLDVLGLRPSAGRSLVDADRSRDEAQAVISQSLADALWPGEPAVGRTLTVGENRRVLQVVGVAPNASYSGRIPQQPGDWGHHVLVAGGGPGDTRDGNPFAPPQSTTFLLRYTGSLQDVSSSIPMALSDVDPRVALVFRQDFAAEMDRQTVGPRMIAGLLVLFAGVSLSIAAVGQYAAVAFNMRRRTREFGVRLALGASARQVLASVMREGGRLTAVGLAAGFALSLAVATVLRSVLSGITPLDPPTYLAVCVLLAVVSLLACYLPARRASRINPVQALRTD